MVQLFEGYALGNITERREREKRPGFEPTTLQFFITGRPALKTAEPQLV